MLRGYPERVNPIIRATDIDPLLIRRGSLPLPDKEREPYSS